MRDAEYTAFKSVFLNERPYGDTRQLSSLKKATTTKGRHEKYCIQVRDLNERLYFIVAHNSQLTTHNSPLTTHHSPLTTHTSATLSTSNLHNSQLTTHHSLPHKFLKLTHLLPADKRFLVNGGFKI